MITERYPTIPLHDPVLHNGRPVALTGRSTIELRWRIKDERVTVGRGTYGAPAIIMYAPDDRVEIGNYCSLAGGCYLLAGGEHDTRATSTFPFGVYLGKNESTSEVPRKGPLRIGSDVWLGFGSTVLGGATVGHGAVVGACAVVAKDVPPFAVAVGNPARVIRYRFPDDVIAELLRVRWWDWHPDRVAEYHPLLQGDPRRFLDSLPADAAATFGGPNPATDAMEFGTIPVAAGARFRSVVRGVTPPFLVRLMRPLLSKGGAR